MTAFFVLYLHHIPDQGCEPLDSYHTRLPLHLCRYPLDQDYMHSRSCHRHLVRLNHKLNVKVAQTRLAMHAVGMALLLVSSASKPMFHFELYFNWLLARTCKKCLSFYLAHSSQLQFCCRCCKSVFFLRSKYDVNRADQRKEAIRFTNVINLDWQ